MAADGEGGAIVAWVDYRSGSADIYAQHVLASGVLDPRWPSGGRAVCTALDAQLVPSIVTDGAGGAIIAWVDRRSESEAGDVHAQRVLSSGVVDPAWPVDGRALCTVREEQGNIVMVADGAGGAMVAWTDPRSSVDGSYPGYFDIYAQHVLAGGDANPAWLSNGIAVCTAPGDQLFPAIVSDEAGGAFLAWGDDRPLGRGNYAQHLVPSGVDPAWPPDGLVFCTRTAGRSAIAPDGAGGAYVAWSDGRGGNPDVYAQHVLSSGVDPAWPVDGSAIFVGTADQIEVAMGADSNGRTFVAWRDTRNGNPDIYALKLDPPHPIRQLRRSCRDELTLHAPRLGHGAEVTIDFELPEPQPVSIAVFDVMGRAVRTIAERHELPAGPHTLTWDGADDAGTPLMDGVYLVRLSSQGRSVTRKHVVLH